MASSAKRAKPINIYRYMSFERLNEIFLKEQLFFARPSSWDDPYETVLKHETADRVFGQCWSKEGASDAMWRIYSHDRLGVRVGSTIKRLKTELAAAEKRKEIKYSVGDVKYSQSMALYEADVAEAQKAFDRDKNTANAAATLFIKRRAFTHENEVRALVHVHPSRTVHDVEKGIAVKVDAHALIRSVLIDPRAEPWIVDGYVRHLQNKLKFEGIVRQSVLYTKPEDEPN